MTLNTDNKIFVNSLFVKKNHEEGVNVNQGTAIAYTTINPITTTSHVVTIPKE